MKTQPPTRKRLVVPLLLALGLNAQAQLLNETFDSASGFTITDGAGAATFFSDGFNDYFGIYDGDGDGGANFGLATTNPTGLPSYTSTGDNYIAGEDLNGEGGTLPFTLTWSGIALSGQTNLEISADFASTRLDAADSVILSYRLDGGAWIELVGIAGAAGTYNSPPYEITNFTTKTGDNTATAINASFTTLSNTFVLAGTETTLDVKADFNSNDGDDNFGLDNLIVQVPVADVTPPLLSSSFPADEDTGILPVTNLELTFNESVQLGSAGNIVIKELVGDAIFESFDVSITARVTASGSKITIDPTSNLDANTGYYLEVDNGAIEDTSGNDYAGFSGNSTLNFETSAPIATGVFINEVDSDQVSTDADEFIELYDGGTGNTSLTGLVLVLFNGSSDTSYRAIDLDGQTTDGSGFFVIGSASVANVDLVNFTSTGTLQNGADAVALYVGNASDFPSGTSVTDVNLLDAVVYDTNDGDDSGLIGVLTPGQPQIDEDENSNKDNESISRSPDGGTQLQTVTYVAQAPTPGATNGGTADTTPPSIVSLSPVDDAPAVLTIENLQIFFDEDIQAGTGNIEIYELGNGTPVQTIDIATATISGSALQVSPANLTAGTAHYVLIDNGAIEDLVGNDFAGITDTTAWSFTTVSGTIVTDEAIRTGDIDTAVNGGGTTSDSFSGQSTSGGNFNDYGVAEFDMSFENFSGNSVTDILSANLILTIDTPYFAASGDFVILFTTDSVGDLSSAADYDQLEYDDLSTNGIDLSSFTDTPVVVGSGTFSDATPGGFEDVVSIDLASIEAELITAINNRDTFHFIIGSVDSDSGAVTYSGVGNTNNLGAPTLALTATTGAPVAAINFSETDGSTNVDETGPTSDTFDVVLNAAPSATITVTVSPDSQVTVDSPTLTFTTIDWFTPQTVTVTAVDDAAFEDATHSGSVSLSASGDVDYSSATNSVSVSIVDNDFGASDAVINEFVADKSGADDGAFIEIYGSPSTDYSSLYILEIEGDSSSPTGNIDAVFQVGTTDANGFWTITDADNAAADVENGTVTLLLVQGFTGSAGDDIDTNDDGTIDNAPWSSIIDGVATFEGGSDIVYDGDAAVTSLDTGFGGVSGQVGGASRIPDGEDNNLDSDWVRNDYEGYGLAGGPAAGTDGQAENTPGASNQIFYDMAAPTISSLTPEDNSTTTELADDLSISFDEDVQAGTGNITLHLTSDDSVVETFDVTTDVIISGDTVTINPAADLNPGVSYYVQITAGAITDTAGTPNSFAGILDTTTWNFMNLTLISSEDFNDSSGDADDWFNATVTGDDPWTITLAEGTIDGYANGDTGVDEHYLISPALDLSSESTITMSFDYSGGYDDSNADSFELVYSTDYNGSGDPEASATWTEITFDFSQNLATLDPAELISSGQIALSPTLDGLPVVYLAFRYNADGTETGSELWYLDNILIQSVTTASDPLTTYLTDRGLTIADFEDDVNGNGYPVAVEYLAGFGDGSGSDVIEFGIDTDGMLALTLTSDLAEEPEGITVSLLATSDLSVAFAPVSFTHSVIDNLDGTFTHIYAELMPPVVDERFLSLQIVAD